MAENIPRLVKEEQDRLDWALASFNTNVTIEIIKSLRTVSDLRAKLAGVESILRELVEEDICFCCGEEARKDCEAKSGQCGGWINRQAARKLMGMPEIEKEKTGA